jgi:hypothetical protein
MNSYKLHLMSMKYDTRKKIETVPQSIIFGGKKYNKPDLLDVDTWNGLIEELQNNDNADFEIMLDNALNESKIS